MCGLIGVFGENMTRADFDFLVQGLHVDVLRGDDGTGIALLGKDGKVPIFKSAHDAYRFCIYERIDLKLAEFLRGNGAIGHNRASTSGGNIDENCHPFRHDNIVLAHNGTLRSRDGLVDARDFVVDSENICNTFSKLWEDDVIPEIDGAFALSWYDIGKKEMNLIRNKERPLFIAKKKNGDTYYWASEEGLLSWMLTRNHISFEKIEKLEVGERNKLHFVGKGKTRKLIRTQTELEVLDYDPKSQYHGGYGDWWGSSWQQQGAKQGTGAASKPSEGNPYNLKSGDYAVVQVDKKNIKPYKGDKNNGKGYIETYTLSGMPCEVHGVDIDMMPGRYTVKVSCTDPLRYQGKNEMDMVYAYSPHLVPVRNYGKDVKDEQVKVEGLTVGEITRNVVETSANEGEGEEEHENFNTWDSLNGIFITEKEFNTRTKDGCCYCSTDVFPSEACEIEWVDSVSPVCSFCQKNEPWIDDKNVLDSYLNQTDDIPF